MLLDIRWFRGHLMIRRPSFKAQQDLPDGAASFTHMPDLATFVVEFLVQ